MISKKMKIGGAALALSLALLAGSSVSAYANVPDSVDTAGTQETAQSVSSESTTESAAKSEAENTAASGESNENKAEGRVTGIASQTADSETDDGVLTPSGNMSLVDNVKEEDKENLDFMTVTSKDGHVFYIVIDHSSNTENVYFLNQVDESDLMALMTDEEKKAIEETADTEKETEEAVTPSVKTDSAETDTSQAETENNKKKEVRSAMDNNLIMGAVFGVIGLVLIGAYYFLKIRPKKKGASIEDDLEFYDDEEYENEDEEPAFEEEEQETSQKPDQEDTSSDKDPEKGARE